MLNLVSTLQARFDKEDNDAISKLQATGGC